MVQTNHFTLNGDFMEIFEFENLKNNEIKIYSSDFNINKTLLYGYDYKRNTYHVYVKDIFIHIMKYKEDILIEHYLSPLIRIDDLNLDFVKRLYPECCDYDFCKRIQQKVDLPFTNFKFKKSKNFHGKIFEEFD